MKAREIIEKQIEFYSRPETQLGWRLLSLDSKRGQCQYFVTENQRCAIGCLLKPETAAEVERLRPGRVITELLEGEHQLDEHLAELQGLLPEDMTTRVGMEFLRCLQRLHDVSLSSNSIDGHKSVLTAYTRAEYPLERMRQLCEILARKGKEMRKEMRAIIDSQTPTTSLSSSASLQ